MEEEKELPKRKDNRLKNYDYSRAGAYFITICTKDRKCLFWDKAQHHSVGEDIILPYENIRFSILGEIADEAINAIPVHYPQVEVVQYVIMPNHIHMILSIPYDDGRMISSPTSILTIVGQMKRYVSKRVGKAIWQKSFHDHIIRNRADYEEHLRYIYENPINWHLDELYTEE